MIRTAQRNTRKSTTQKPKQSKKKAKEVVHSAPYAHILLDNITCLCAHYGITDKELCAALDISPQTLQRRRKFPNNFNESDKQILADLFHISVPSLYEDLRRKFDETLRASEV